MTVKLWGGGGNTTDQFHFGGNGGGGGAVTASIEIRPADLAPGSFQLYFGGHHDMAVGGGALGFRRVTGPAGGWLLMAGGGGGGGWNNGGSGTGGNGGAGGRPGPNGWRGSKRYRWRWRYLHSPGSRRRRPGECCMRAGRRSGSSGVWNRLRSQPLVAARRRPRRLRSWWGGWGWLVWRWTGWSEPLSTGNTGRGRGRWRQLCRAAATAQIQILDRILGQPGIRRRRRSYEGSRYSARCCAAMRLRSWRDLQPQRAIFDGSPGPGGDHLR